MSNYSESRFGFGRNWQNFAKNLNEDQIQAAIESLRLSLNIHDFSNMRILDAGCGSGLFSLAACRLGAAEVVSFDYDPNSVSCTENLKRRFGPYSNWSITSGDVLDENFLTHLGHFDLVYSWGVLHHTGNMWRALENVSSLVKPGGLLFISIYNDQDWISRLWKKVKKLYVRSPGIIQISIALFWYINVLAVRVLSGVLKKKPIRDWFRTGRGMNLWYDTVDWVGGYPFETASVDALQSFLENHEFSVVNLLLNSGSGCNQFIATKNSTQLP